ncbi:outer membrane protein assembly factor BamB [Halomonas sp. DP1Y21-3]|uniref:outer membrane protein assembly factor BamB n=1 Tax=Halomonas sp. DP1Y21-3 TaxID=2859080 RepID=UPI001C947D33|nr:outer membrane protein assembly factor BamB [Halomonas sp. DP1Y21-3]MBY6109557.1 outer membrane protein assembly factor BamB [Halomonas sp. DP1Y21-3]
MKTPFNRTRIALATAVTLTALLTGCASKSEPQYPPKELKDFAESTRVETRWSEGVGAGLGEATYPIEPALAGSTLFAADEEGLVEAFNTANGDTQWEAELESPISSGITAVDGDLFLATRNGEVVALDQRNGRVKWRTRVPSEVLAAPQPTTQLLIVQAVDGTVTALDRLSGDRQWVFSANMPSLTLRSTGTPTAIDQVTFAGFANGRLSIIDNRSGQQISERTIAVATGMNDINRLVDLAGQPVLTPDGRLFVTSFNGRLVALNAQSGETLWSTPLSSYHTPVLVGETLYVVDEASRLIAFDANSGNELWRLEDLYGRSVTAPAFADGRIVLGDAEGYVHFIDASSGRLVGRTHIDGSGISVRPLTDGKRVYALANDGSLEALDIRP